jgi:TM2 domain-containing membrane protein YozV
MPHAAPPPAAGHSRPDPFAAVLSCLVPGLGQIYQGRVGKGLLFLFGLYGMFFYGMFLGQWSNVFLADTAVPNPKAAIPLIGEVPVPRWMANLYNRPHFAGQFWMGVAAWPAIWRYTHDAPNQFRGKANNRQEFIARFEAAPSEAELNDLQRDGDKHWDLGWVYTVIAGALNVLVIYDALVGPAFGHGTKAEEPKPA